jgi:hypothetical protein
MSASLAASVRLGLTLETVLVEPSPSVYQCAAYSGTKWGTPTRARVGTHVHSES